MHKGQDCIDIYFKDETIEEMMMNITPQDPQSSRQSSTPLSGATFVGTIPVVERGDNTYNLGRRRAMNRGNSENMPDFNNSRSREEESWYMISF